MDDDVAGEGGHPNERHADSVWRKDPRRHPVQPSPPTLSRSSSGVADSRISGGYIPPMRSTSSLPTQTSKLDLHDLLNKPNDMRRESSTASRLPLVPYGNRPAERPSLPSLRTVLGSTISSPPKTPSPQTAISRSSPSQAAIEPNYTEPYPSKKQRTESAEYHSRALVAEATSSTSYGSSTTLEPQYNSHSTKHDSAVYPSGVRSERTDDYRGSLPPLPTPGSTASWANYSASHNANTTSKRSSFGEVSSSRPEPSYAHYGLEERRRGSYAPDSWEKTIDERTLPLHPASRNTVVYSPQSQDRDPSRLSQSEDSWYSNQAREGSSYSPNDNFDRSSQSSSQAVENNSSFSSPSNTQPFFMSGHFDASNSRSRKRSNLPKHSTEIMKRWFEQNMANPYPSEEQKAIFANATGISLTQVSNWFINHRRRCPELRDKREKNRIEHEKDEQD